MLLVFLNESFLLLNEITIIITENSVLEYS